MSPPHRAWCDSPPGGGAEDLRRGGERHLGVRAGQLVDPVDGEPGVLDGRAGVPAAVAAADEQWPDRGVQGLLDAAPPGGGGPDVFEEPQFAARLEDTAVSASARPWSGTLHSTREATATSHCASAAGRSSAVASTTLTGTAARAALASAMNRRWGSGSTAITSLTVAG